jgi:hypothetical protein
VSLFSDFDVLENTVKGENADRPQDESGQQDKR